MNFFSEQLGLINPLMILGMPLIFGFLIYVYLKKGQSAQKIVASLFLLKILKTKNPAKQKINLPRRFYFELLFLSLLALALSGLYLTRSSDKIIFLIDNSLSMGTLSNQTERLSLLQQALTQASVAINSLPAQALIEVYQTSPTLSSTTQGFVSISKALDLLKQIKISYAEDNLEAQINKLLNSEFNQIYIFSDYQKDKESPENIHYVRLASEDSSQSNISISDLNFDSVSNQLQVTINNFSSSNNQILLSIEYLNTTDQKVQNPASITLQVAAHQQIKKSLLIDSHAHSLKASIAYSTTPNLLLLDDQAFLNKTVHSKKVYLISQNQLSNLGLNQLPNFNFEQILADNFNADYAKKIEQDHAIAIFDNLAPKTLAKFNALYIKPPQQNQLFSTQSLVSAQVSGWQDAHPITSYLNLSSLNFNQLAPLKSEIPWLTSIIETTKGAALLAGENSKLRVVVTGFELFPYLGKESKTLSILTLNILKWLSSASLENGYINVYSSLDPSITKLQDSSGTELSNLKAGIALPGIYKTDNQEIAVNFFSDRESNLTKKKYLSLNQKSKNSLTSNKSKNNLQNTLLGLVLILICSDLLLGLWKNKRRQS
jgi:hypothetical protein